MGFISGYVNIFLLCIIFWLGKNDMTSAVYQIPAVIAVVIGWIATIKSNKQAHKK